MFNLLYFDESWSDWSGCGGNGTFDIEGGEGTALDNLRMKFACEFDAMEKIVIEDWVFINWCPLNGSNVSIHCFEQASPLISQPFDQPHKSLPMKAIPSLLRLSLLQSVLYLHFN
jgi:hypothetical protein